MERGQNAFQGHVRPLPLQQATLIKKVITWKLIGIYFGLITVAIIPSGYLFNITL